VSSVAPIVQNLRLLRAKKFLLKHQNDTYPLARKCFRTYDPKDPNKRTKKPWPHTERRSHDPRGEGEGYHEEIWHLLENPGHVTEAWNRKSKQTFFSWTYTGFPTAQMLTKPGFRAFAQSRRDDASEDLKRRVAYILRNLGGPLENILIENQDWYETKDEVWIKSVAGIEMDSMFKSLPSGAAQWRFPAVSYALVDELAYHREQRSTLAAARSATEGGGFLVVNSTPKYGTFFNEEFAKIMAEGGQLA